VGDLGAEAVEVEGRDGGDHPLRYPQRHGDEVGLGEGREVCQAVEAAADRFKDTGIAQGVEVTRVNPRPQDLGGAKHAPGPAKDLADPHCWIVTVHGRIECTSPANKYL
jgi:hypothetical protein